MQLMVSIKLKIGKSMLLSWRLTLTILIISLAKVNWIAKN